MKSSECLRYDATHEWRGECGNGFVKLARGSVRYAAGDRGGEAAIRTRIPIAAAGFRRDIGDNNTMKT